MDKQKALARLKTIASRHDIIFWKKTIGDGLGVAEIGRTFNRKNNASGHSWTEFVGTGNFRVENSVGEALSRGTHEEGAMEDLERIREENSGKDEYLPHTLADIVKGYVYTSKYTADEIPWPC